jgi:hypothetical protein
VRRLGANQTADAMRRQAIDEHRKPLSFIAEPGFVPMKPRGGKRTMTSSRFQR